MATTMPTAAFVMTKLMPVSSVRRQVPPELSAMLTIHTARYLSAVRHLPKECEWNTHCRVAIPEMKHFGQQDGNSEVEGCGYPRRTLRFPESDDSMLQIAHRAIRMIRRL